MNYNLNMNWRTLMNLENEMATHSSVLAWRIPGMGESGGLPSMGSHRVGHDWSDLAAAAAAWISRSSDQKNVYSGNTICTIQLLDVMSQEKRMIYGVRATF